MKPLLAEPLTANNAVIPSNLKNGRFVLKQRVFTDKTLFITTGDYIYKPIKMNRTLTFDFFDRTNPKIYLRITNPLANKLSFKLMTNENLFKNVNSNIVYISDEEGNHIPIGRVDEAKNQLVIKSSNFNVIIPPVIKYQPQNNDSNASLSAIVLRKAIFSSAVKRVTNLNRLKYKITYPNGQVGLTMDYTSLSYLTNASVHLGTSKIEIYAYDEHSNKSDTIVINSRCLPFDTFLESTKYQNYPFWKVSDSAAPDNTHGSYRDVLVEIELTDYNSSFTYDVSLPDPTCPFIIDDVSIVYAYSKRLMQIRGRFLAFREFVMVAGTSNSLLDPNDQAIEAGLQYIPSDGTYSDVENQIIFLIKTTISPDIAYHSYTSLRYWNYPVA
jgi:hypothetical protein